MLTFDKMLDEVMQFDYSTREMFLEILKKRQVEETRKIIAKEYRKAKADFLKGKTKSISASEVIKQLNSL